MNKLLSEFKSGFMYFLEIFSAPTNLVLLFIAYILGVGFSSILARLTKNAGWPQIDEKAESYWEDMPAYDEDSYYSQL